MWHSSRVSGGSHGDSQLPPLPPISELPARDQRRRTFGLTLGLDWGISCPLTVVTVLTQNSYCAAMMPRIACASLEASTRISAT